MADAPLPDLVLYSRTNCHLCDEARELLHALLDERRHRDLATPTLTGQNIVLDGGQRFLGLSRDVQFLET